MIKRILNKLNPPKFNKETLLKVKEIFQEENDNTRIILSTYAKYLKNNASKKELKIANNKLKDILRGIGIGSLLIIPGSFITLPLLLISAKKLGIDVLPKSFYDKFPDLKENKPSNEK